MKLTTRRLTRAGVVAALYTALTMSFGALAYGPVQVRPSEALTLLPLFFPEAVLGLFAGCLLSNLFSGYGIFDITLGSLATFIAALCTYGSGRLIKRHLPRALTGSIFPVILNAFVLPLIFRLSGDKTAFFALFYPVLLTQAVWVFVLGIPLYFAVLSYRRKNISFFN